MNQIDFIKDKIRKGTATVSEIGYAITQDRHLLFNMLMDNNLADVNVTLRTELGQRNNLPFAPNRKAIEQVINAYIIKNDIKSLQKILDEFDYNPKANNYTTHVGFIQQLKTLSDR